MEMTVVAKVILNMHDNAYDEKKKKLESLGYEPYNVTNGERRINGEIVQGRWQRWRKVLLECEI